MNGQTCQGIYSVDQGIAAISLSYTVLDQVRIAPFVGQYDEQATFSHAEGDCGPDQAFSTADSASRFAYGLELETDVGAWRRRTLGIVFQLAKARANHDVPTYGTEYEQNLIVSLGIGGRLW